MLFSLIGNDFPPLKGNNSYKNMILDSSLKCINDVLLLENIARDKKFTKLILPMIKLEINYDFHELFLYYY